MLGKLLHIVLRTAYVASSSSSVASCSEAKTSRAAFLPNDGGTWARWISKGFCLVLADTVLWIALLLVLKKIGRLCRYPWRVYAQVDGRVLVIRLKSFE